MDETPRAKRNKASREKEPMSSTREIQSVSPDLVMENDDLQKVASQAMTPYGNLVVFRGGPSQSKSVSQEELNAELLLTLRAMREATEQKDKIIVELTRESFTKKRCLPSPPLFTGVGIMAKVKEFLMETEVYFEAQGTSEKEKVQVAATFLKDHASHWWQTFTKENPDQVVDMTWDKFKGAVTQRFTPQNQRDEIQRHPSYGGEISLRPRSRPPARNSTYKLCALCIAHSSIRFDSCSYYGNSSVFMIARDFIFTQNDQLDNSRGTRDEASTSSGHESRLSQESIERISDALYKFYEPAEARSANLDIFFFHGLECEGAHVQNAHISSWRSSSKLEEIWPQKWLSQDFPHSRIISISYDCSTKQSDEGGTMDMYRITENLLQEIIWCRKERDCDRRMIFVGHGFGGIVMKQLCVYAHNRKEDLVGGRDVSMFLDSIRGFFFYATPHLGVVGLRPPGKKDGPLLRWMYALNEGLARLHEAFCKLKQLERYRWIIFAVAGQDSTLGRPGLRLREGSSRYGDNYITVTSSHFYVCRPSDKTSNEYQHLKTLIQDVLRRVESERKPYLTVPKVIVGFDGLVTEVLEEHLQIHKFVGICGMGGIGKTTLAKLIFNKACVDFEFTCFAEEIKGLTGPKSDIKRKLWEQMCHRGVPVRKADQVYEDVWYQVKGKSLLLIFDDVDDDQHVDLLQEIAVKNECEESRFILTSRKSELLHGDNIHTIRPDHLGKEDSEKLLTAYAFPKEQELSESLRKIIHEVIEACEGLPLTLEILGKHLRSRRSELWAEIPIALRRCTKHIANLEHKLWARLQLSYDGLLEKEVQNMFLDIASFFILKDKCSWDHPFDVDDAIMAWSFIYGCEQNSLQILEDRSLVTVRRHELWGVKHTEFYMHEHLRRMGQRIAREKGRILGLSWIRSSPESMLQGDRRSEDQDSHLYDEEVVFQGSKDELGKIVAHRVMISRNSMAVLAQACGFCIMHELWPKLAAIQFMDLWVDVTDCCEQCRSRRVLPPSTLVLLRLRLWGCALRVEAGGNSAGDVSGTLSLSACTSLVRLKLINCRNLGELSRLQQLRVLMISSCGGARTWLPSLGELRRLTRLELLHIGEPFELPISFGHLTALQCLEISGCIVLSIPSSFSNLRNLRFLVIEEFAGRQAISVASFAQLRRFKMKCLAITDVVNVFRYSTTCL